MTVGLERMPPVYFLQHWFSLSDPAAEEALYGWYPKHVKPAQGRRPMESIPCIEPTFPSASVATLTVIVASRPALLAFLPITYSIKPATPYAASFSVASMSLVD